MSISRLQNCNFLTDSNYKNEPSYGPIIDLNIFNKYFFGSIENPLRTPVWHHVDTNIFIEMDGKTYLKLDKINDYINLIGDLNDRELYFSLYNYYNIFNNWDIVREDTFNYKLKNFIDNFLEFLKINNNKYDINQYKLYKVIIKCLQGKFIKMYLNNYEGITKTWVITFQIYENIYCNITFGLDDDYSNVISYVNLNNYNYNKFINIADCFVNSIRTSSPEKYIIGNLTEITGNKTFAKILYRTHKQREDYIMPIELVSRLIKWKSTEAKNNYLTFFKEKYYNSIENDSLNFDAFNKFFLNLETSYLKDFEEKEKINDLYTNITSGLIKGYEELYEYIKQ